MSILKVGVVSFIAASFGLVTHDVGWVVIAAFVMSVGLVAQDYHERSGWLGDAITWFVIRRGANIRFAQIGWLAFVVIAFLALRRWTLAEYGWSLVTALLAITVFWILANERAYYHQRGEIRLNQSVLRFDHPAAYRRLAVAAVAVMALAILLPTTTRIVGTAQASTMKKLEQRQKRPTTRPVAVPGRPVKIGRA